jgi:uncharacterized protein (TIGR01244 family)
MLTGRWRYGTNEEKMMDLRQITSDFAVAPQIEEDDIQELVNAGYRTIISNRPDNEVAGGFDSSELAKRAADAGVEIHYLPYFPGAMTPELVAEFEAVMAETEGPVLAYCRSGTRSSHLWAMSQVGTREVDEILSLAANAGYDLSPMEGLLRAYSSQKQV